MIWIDTFFKHAKTRNENMVKYTKIEQMAHEMLLTEDKAIPRIASSKTSDQKCIARENLVKIESVEDIVSLFQYSAKI